MQFIERVKELLGRVALSCLDKKFNIVIDYDKEFTIRSWRNFFPNPEPKGRVFIQLTYDADCTKSGEHVDNWKGRKWYLSKHMTDSEIIFTCFAAFEAAVKHEVLEGFKVDGKIMINPHINFEELLKISKEEVKRS